MFTVEALVKGVWVIDVGGYYLHDSGTSGAIAAARRGIAKDSRPRRVVTYPGGVEVWNPDTPQKRKQKTIGAR